MQWAEKGKTPVEGTEDFKCYPQKFTHLSLGEKDSSSEICIFCDKLAASGKSLCRASTLKMDSKVQECALKLQDQKLLARLSAGDLIAQEQS